MEQLHQIKTYLNGGRQTSRVGGGDQRRGSYVPVNRQEAHVVREAATGSFAESPYTSHRHPTPSMATTSSSRLQRTNTPTTDMSSHQRDDQLNSEAGDLNKLHQNLKAEYKRLGKRISEMEESNIRGRKKLERMKARDEEEKWEDELFETRTKELESAHAIIETHSSASRRDVRDQVKELNRQIAHIASAAVEVRITREDQSGVLESINKILGQGFLFLFQRSEYRLEDKEIVRAILQIFLARSCVELIDSWYIGRRDLNSRLNRLYHRILSKESQGVAGKWRQIAFKQLPHGPEQEILQQFASFTAGRLMEISSCAGWGGDISKIQQLVLRLAVDAEVVRMDVKAGIISSDLRPWVAMCGALYDPSFMKDAARKFGMTETEDAERCRVLGSTEMGLKVYWTPEDGARPELRPAFRTRVLLIEPLERKCRRPTRS